MKTTVVLDDVIYEMLKETSARELRTRRGVSEYLNKVLHEFFSRKQDKEMFGSSSRFDIKGYRDEDDRIA